MWHWTAIWLNTKRAEMIHFTLILSCSSLVFFFFTFSFFHSVFSQMPWLLKHFLCKYEEKYKKKKNIYTNVTRLLVVFEFRLKSMTTQQYTMKSPVNEMSTAIASPEPSIRMLNFSRYSVIFFFVLLSTYLWFELTCNVFGKNALCLSVACKCICFPFFALAIPQSFFHFILLIFLLARRKNNCVANEENEKYHWNELRQANICFNSLTFGFDFYFFTWSETERRWKRGKNTLYLAHFTVADRKKENGKRIARIS